MKKSETKYIRRTQKDYSMSFKLSVVQEYETSRLSMETIQRKYGIQGSHTLKRWIEKYGNFDVSNKSHCPVEKSKEQQLLELEQKIKLLERKNARLEKELELKDIKAEFFDMMIDIAEKEYHIDIRKNSFPEQSSNTKKKNP
ncbi:transposase [Parabacteroides provencensis]|uniref:transposase n=1 Tax=Parabacteroides provencensis TaxID=1944636 RepID=UPI001E35CE3B|nr:transposase [Parabacteroides provencensis]